MSELTVTAKKSHAFILQSIFVGGGTPSVLPCESLTKIIDWTKENFHLSKNVEISVEVNPGTIDEKYLLSLFASGVNRLSMGVQSFDNQQLKILGRIHTREVAIEAVHWAKKSGFTNINLDLMYGIPGQSPASWEASLGQALALDPQHLSLYQLTIEEGTPFFDDLAMNKFELPIEDEVHQMDELTQKLCQTAGISQYEIANYATSGNRCIHNVNYWENGEYLACGAAAVSCIGGVREKRLADPREYVKRMARGENVIVEYESLPVEASFRESVVLGLRMVEGVSLSHLQQRYGIDLVHYYGPILEKLEKWQMVEKTVTHLRLTGQGRRIANSVMSELV
jgi:oxygen-independent coproporphyrinogen-3 oxidase